MDEITVVMLIVLGIIFGTVIIINVLHYAYSDNDREKNQEIIERVHCEFLHGVYYDHECWMPTDGV